MIRGSIFSIFVTVCLSKPVRYKYHNLAESETDELFFTFLLYLVNHSDLEIQSIQLCYFEPGHTFMSCDSLHHSIELSMKHMKNVFDSEDFKKAVNYCLKNVLYI